MESPEHHGGIDVVAFSPHPDDVEFFCSGALLLAADAGRSTAVVDLTEGELSTNGDPGRRSTERAAATELLGLRARMSLHLPDGSLGTDPGHRDADRPGAPRAQADRGARAVLGGPPPRPCSGRADAAGGLLPRRCREVRDGAGAPRRDGSTGTCCTTSSSLRL